VTGAGEPVAIVGAGLRFPGGNDTLDGFDAFLRAGGSGIRPLPRDRWDVDAFAPAEPGSPGSITTTAGGFLDRIDEFDAQFFNISPKQAPYIDPAQRILLETAWEALENANIDPTPLRHGNGSVYIGASPLDFAFEMAALDYRQLDATLATGNGAYSLSGRLSYFLGWRGPSLTTDTACAASLTALHLAVEGLRRGESDIALCGAVNVLYNPRSFVILSQGQMLAPDGRCKTFDEAADGYARAEGCGVLVLKRLSDARRDGDTVLAVVRGTAIGQDGESAGLTAPNGSAQEAVTRAALASGGLEPANVQYVEAHGTGTPLGDPIEMGSIHGVFGAAHDKLRPLTVGSLKSNIGHMEPAAGVGAIIKVILQLRAGVFYPSLLETPSGRIPWDTYPVTVPTECRPWDTPVRRATVHGFGVTGAIGVAVLEQAPEQAQRSGPADDPGQDSHVFTLSAKTEPALARQIDRYRRFLAANPDVALADLCHTGNVGRAHLRHRVAGAVRTAEELTDLLDSLLDAAQARDGRRRQESYRKVAFLFTGSGSQYAGMGEALYRRFPEFRTQVDRCDALFSVHLGRSIADIMFDRVPDAAELLDRTRYAHAALFTLEYALAALWRSFGVRPTALIGHSVGEIVAATVAGVFSLTDGVAFLDTRARLIESIPVPGGMAAVAAPAERIAPLLVRWPDLGIGAINAPDQCVVSGAADSLSEAATVLREKDLTVTSLKVSSGFHSPLIAGISAELRAALERMELNEPELTIVSNLTGEVVAPGTISTPEYWVRHAGEAVDFAAGVSRIGGRGKHVFVEIGPSSALTSLARRSLPDNQHRWFTSLHRRDTTGATMQQALAGMYTAGLPISWRGVHNGQNARRTSLPGYAFDRQRYWLPGGTGGGPDGHPLLGRQVDGAGLEFASRISATDPGYLADHTINGQVFLPAAGYVEMLLAVADAHYGDTSGALEDIRFHEAMFLGEQPVEVRTRASVDGDRLRVEIVSRPPGTPVERRHLTATLVPPRPSGERPTSSFPVSGEAPDDVLSGAEVYAAYAGAGYDYGPRFNRVTSVSRYGPDLAVGELTGGDVSRAEYLPPPLLDGATHALAALVDRSEQYVATGIRRLRMFKKPRARHLRSIVRRTRQGTAFALDVLLLEGDLPVAELSGMDFVRLGGRPAAADAPARTSRAERPRAIDPAALRTASAPERRDAIVDLIRHTVAGLLSIADVNRVDTNATFLELGVDSLTAIDLRNTLESRLRVSFPSSVVFDQPSVDQLAKFLDTALSDGRRP